MKHEEEKETTVHKQKMKRRVVVREWVGEGGVLGSNRRNFSRCKGSVGIRISADSGKFSIFCFSSLLHPICLHVQAFNVRERVFSLTNGIEPNW